jgi:hypothetical protein
MIKFSSDDEAGTIPNLVQEFFQNVQKFRLPNFFASTVPVRISLGGQSWKPIILHLM